MRFHNSTQWAAARDAHKAAYAVYDAFAEAGDDGIDCGGTQASTDASKAEYAALRAVLTTPAITPLDVSGKLDIMGDREITEGWGEEYEQYVAQIKADLFQLQRMACSPEMKALFNHWAEARRAYFAAAGVEHTDEDLEPHWQAETENLRALMAAPCCASGDIMVKAYVEWIDNHGSLPTGAIFMPAQGSSSYPHDQICDDARRRDILDTDIGRCMAALGRVDFDARAWVEAALECGVKPSLILHEGKRQFGYDMNAEAAGAEERWRLLTYLLGSGGEEGRSRLVADEIEASWPDLVWGRADAPQAVAA